MTQHAKLSPSSSKIWMVCPRQPAFVVEKAELISPKEERFSNTGRVAHELAALCLEQDKDALALVGKGEIDQEMSEAVQVYLDHIRTTRTEGCIEYIEVPVSISEEVWGTADFVRYDPATKRVTVVDYKHGEGVFVSAVNNFQLLIYAIAAAVVFPEAKEIEAVIVQPRCPSEEVIRGVTLSAEELLDARLRLEAAIAAARDPDAPFVTGEHCRWCKAAAFCPELKQKTALERIHTESASHELADALDKIPALKAWIKAVENEALALARRGGDIPGYRLGQSLSVRTWVDVEAAKEALKAAGIEDIYTPPALMTPPVIERHVGKKRFAEEFSHLAARKPCGVTLVRENSPVPPYLGAQDTDYLSVERWSLPRS